MTKGKMELALLDINTAIEKDPTYCRSFCYRGYIFYLLGRYEESMIDCNK